MGMWDASLRGWSRESTCVYGERVPPRGPALLALSSERGVLASSRRLSPGYQPSWPAAPVCSEAQELLHGPWLKEAAAVGEVDKEVERGRGIRGGQGGAWRGGA